MASCPLSREFRNTSAQVRPHFCRPHFTYPRTGDARTLPRILPFILLMPALSGALLASVNSVTISYKVTTIADLSASKFSRITKADNRLESGRIARYQSRDVYLAISILLQRNILSNMKHAICYTESSRISPGCNTPQPSQVHN